MGSLVLVALSVGCGSATLRPDADTRDGSGGSGGTGGSGGRGGSGGTGGDGGSGGSGDAGLEIAPNDAADAADTGGDGQQDAGCTPSAKQCNGLQPQTCTNGQWQNTGTACGACQMCSTATGSCAPVTNGTTCTDNNGCTVGDTCQSGVCTPGPAMTCTAPGCKVAGTCNPATGACSTPTNATNGTSCSDSDACTQPDSCQGGACTGTQIFCNSPPACRLNTTCSAGNCNYTQAVPDGTMDAKCTTADPTTPYCYSGGCVQCTMDSHCLGTVMPSCNPSSRTCVCRRPSANNRLMNPGFDGSFNGWSIYFATLVVDSEGCSNSKAVYSENAENDPSQCIPLTPGSYWFGGQFKGGQTGNFFRIRFHTQANCGGSAQDVFDFFLQGSADWSPIFQQFTVPAGTVSVNVSFFGLGQYLDQLYLSPFNQF